MFQCKKYLKNLKIGLAYLKYNFSYDCILVIIKATVEVTWVAPGVIIYNVSSKE